MFVSALSFHWIVIPFEDLQEEFDEVESSHGGSLQYQPQRSLVRLEAAVVINSMIIFDSSLKLRLEQASS